MNKMKKKICKFSFIFILSALLIGCGLGGQSYPSNSRGVVNAFLGELIEGDLEGALTYCDEEGEAYQELEPITEKNMIHELAVSLSPNEDDQKKIENNKHIQKWIHSYYEFMYKNYQIVDVYEDKNEPRYNIGISKIDADSNSLYRFLVGDALFYKYYEDNQEELDALYEEQGESSVIMKYIDDKGKEIANSYMDALKNNATYSSQNYSITMRNIEGKWKIVSFQ